MTMMPDLQKGIAMGRNGWASLAGRITAVASVGAFIGWVISRDVDWAMAESGRECAQAQEQICVGVAPVAGLAFGITLTVVSCWVIMAVAGVRPLGSTVPSAITLVILATAMWPVPGGRLHPAWEFSLTTIRVERLPAHDRARWAASAASGGAVG